MKTQSDIPQGTNRCHLERDHANCYVVLASLELLKTYFEDHSQSQKLLRCKECGQLYFCDFQDVSRYFDNHGMQDHVLIPVENTVDADMLFAQPSALRAGLPALVMTWPPEDAEPYWVNRE